MKKLELKDLCGYLPYGLKMKAAHPSRRMNDVEELCHENMTKLIFLKRKPLLLPLSALTEPMEGQDKITWMDYIWHEIVGTDRDMYDYDYFCELVYSVWCPMKVTEYLYSKHFWLGDQSFFDQGIIIDKRTVKL